MPTKTGSALVVKSGGMRELTGHEFVPGLEDFGFEEV
jgi:hypothetical protein